MAQVPAQQLRAAAGAGCGGTSEWVMVSAAAMGSAVKQQRAFGLARQVPHHRRQDDHAHFEENRQAHQEGGTSMAQAARSLPKRSSSQSASARPPPEYSR